MSETKLGPGLLHRDQLAQMINERDARITELELQLKDLQQDTTGDQVECTDTQAEWEKYSPTTD